MSSVWETLSKIDCNEHVEKKGQFSYLAWTWAWAMVKNHYPDATYDLLDDTVFPDGTMEVRVKVTIDGLAHTMWLPVLNYQNKAIPNPGAFDINTSRMRALVKACAMHGLGHYIYAGESMPDTGPVITQEQIDEFMALIADGNGMALIEFMAELGEEATSEAFNAAPKGQKTRLKDEVRRLSKEAHTVINDYVTQIDELLTAGDPAALELAGELEPFEKRMVWSQLTDIQKIQMKKLTEEAA
jgi:hypothetical protein